MPAHAVVPATAAEIAQAVRAINRVNNRVNFAASCMIGILIASVLVGGLTRYFMRH